MLLRSRGGCPRCRSLKIKCDESKPSCRQCVRRKVTCPGYKRDLRWSDKHEVFTSVRVDGAAHEATTSISAFATESLAPAGLSQPGPELPPGLPEPAVQTHPQSMSSTTEQTATSHTPTQDPISLTVGSYPTLDHPYQNRSSTAIFRDDLRDWLVSHEPMTLLQQHDWSWTLTGSPFCDDSTPYVAPLPSQDVTASQGSEINQALVQYFFDNLCCIHSVLDDSAERFKALVRRYLSTSPLLRKSIVCMAANHCLQGEESMLPMCLECHSEAFKSLSEAVHRIETVVSQSTDSPRNSVLSENNMLRRLEETLLASIILGFCAVCIPSAYSPSSPQVIHVLTSESHGLIREISACRTYEGQENCASIWSIISPLMVKLRTKYSQTQIITSS
jgi:hypothetical protein